MCQEWRKTMGALVWLALASAVAFGQGQEIGFVEKFALAQDREKALEQLIPGTEEHYFYQCLNHQNNGRYDAVDETLAPWIQRHGRTALVIEIENRQALLLYGTDRTRALEYLRNTLNLHFNHQRDSEQPPDLPTALDPATITWKAFAERARSRRPDTLDGFEDRALERLAGADLPAELRRMWLSRLTRPDVEGLVDLIVADLRHENSGGFGSLAIHNALTLAQLEELGRKQPDLMIQTSYVNQRLLRLRPGADVDWHGPAAHSLAARQAYLERLWEFVSSLEPVFNALKVHVLYHRLAFDRSQGVYDRARFMAYLALPRNVGYIARDVITQPQTRGFVVNLGEDFSAWTGLAPIGNDEALVRDYLAVRLAREQDRRPYEAYINDVYLKHLFAETMILNGLGDQEQWASDLPPDQYQALRERVDLDFVPSNRRYFARDEAVTLEMDIKGVDRLIVRIYEINTIGFYRSQLREINTDIDLDGLVANAERAPETLDQSPLRRVRRGFEFPEIEGPGVYVVEFIGGGKSSRALIRKGALRPLETVNAGGHRFIIIDERNEKVTDAAIWMGGQRFEADGDGAIAVPFSTNPGHQTFVIESGPFAALGRFFHQGETYALSAGFYVDRESLIARRNAEVVVRPWLTVGGEPISPTLLENVRLVIQSVDRDGVPSEMEITDFPLYDDRESTAVFKTPEHLASLTFHLRGRIRSLSRGADEDLSASDTFRLNDIDASERIADCHLLQSDGIYFLQALGKTGEARPDRPIRVWVKHRDFRDPYDTMLLSDGDGRVRLGALEDIDWARVQDPDGVQRLWTLRPDRAVLPASKHAVAGEPVLIPWMGEGTDLTRHDVALVEIRAGVPAVDHFAALSVRDGMLVAQGLEAGDYRLVLKGTGHEMLLRLTEKPMAVAGAPFLLSQDRLLEVRNPHPLQIADITADDAEVVIRLVNATTWSRVHVYGTRYAPATGVFEKLGAFHGPEPLAITAPLADSVYLSGRNIGDEYRYIIDRRYAEKLPGNMLTRPGLLLNPWELRRTEADRQEAAEGEDADAMAEPMQAEADRAQREDQARMGEDAFSNLDFLAGVAPVLLNLRPDEEGVIRIAMEALGDRRHLHIVAVDVRDTVYRSLTLPEVPTLHRDLRMADILNPDNHYTEKKIVSVIRGGEAFVIEDALTAQFETYDSLARVYQLYMTLSRDARLTDFVFLLQWPTLSDGEKRDKYSLYACHELNFFLYNKDRPFFDQVVRPYLAHKLHKTFMDHWLLEDDLAAYAQPWAYGRLNVVERILLARRLDTDGQRVVRLIADMNDLVPPNRDEWNRLFLTAIQGGALDISGVSTLAGEGVVNLFFASDKAVDEMSHFEWAGQRPLGMAMAPPPAPASASAHFGIADAERYDSSDRRGVALGDVKMVERLGRDQQVMAGAVVNGPARLLSRSRVSGLADGRMGGGAFGGMGGGGSLNGDMVFDMDMDGYVVDNLSLSLGSELRRKAVTLYQIVDKTMELAENNYYKMPIEAQHAGLAPVSDFWLDYARHGAEADGSEEPFLSPHLAQAHRTLTEMLFALAVLDLPFRSDPAEADLDGARLTVQGEGDRIVFHKEIRPAPRSDEPLPVLVNQSFFRQGDRHRMENNVQVDKFITDEFLVAVLYGCEVVITNPTSTRLQLDVLLQIPAGAVPALGGRRTRSLSIDINPYGTWKTEYYFYFPLAGEFEHFPVHVARNEAIVASAEPFVFTVVEAPTRVDTESWDYVSQRADLDTLVAFLEKHNPSRYDLGRIAWRMKDRAAFDRVVALLRDRQVYHHTLWSYAIHHDATADIGAFLRHCDGFLNGCGLWLDSPLVQIDPVERRLYQHLEYSPLVNARAHRLGRERTIVNDRLRAQVQQFMRVLAYRPDFNEEELLSIVYYLLLQDRVGEAREFFNRIDSEALATARLQYDYLRAYLDFYNAEPTEARSIAAEYADYPVERWRRLFAEVADRLAELDGKAVPDVIDEMSRDQRQARLAAEAPAVDFKVEGRQLRIQYRNVARCDLHFYEMDLELLFSRNPFVQDRGDQFASIMPNLTLTVDLAPDSAEKVVALPDRFHRSNVMIELLAGGLRRTEPCYANTLSVRISESHGQVQVAREESGEPLAATYVKVYARMNDGQVLVE